MQITSGLALDATELGRAWLAALGLLHKVRQLGDIGRDPPRLATRVSGLGGF